MKYNFCTLFNSAYLSRGMVLYHSLKKHCSSFHLYVFAFDDATLDFFKSGGFDHLTVVSLKEFEDESLLAIKGSRTPTEYCWTCTASTILYSIEKFNLESCTYIDADMCFYADPALLFQEWGSNSVMITKHNYTPAYDQSEISGKYCVQFVAFKNDEKGLRVLKDWRRDTINWCYARVEEGKFGDQKYLDKWQGMYEGVHVVTNEGAGLAPWNIQKYAIDSRNGMLQVRNRVNGQLFPVVFFHFHGLKFYREGIVLLTGTLYELNKEVIDVFYRSYLRDLLEEGGKPEKSLQTLNMHGIQGEAPKKPLTLFLYMAYYIKDVFTAAKNLDGRSLRERKLHHHYYYIASLIK